MPQQSKSLYDGTHGFVNGHAVQTLHPGEMLLPGNVRIAMPDSGSNGTSTIHYIYEDKVAMEQLRLDRFRVKAWMWFGIVSAIAFCVCCTYLSVRFHRFAYDMPEFAPRGLSSTS